MILPANLLDGGAATFPPIPSVSALPDAGFPVDFAALLSTAAQTDAASAEAPSALPTPAHPALPASPALPVSMPPGLGQPVAAPLKDALPGVATLEADLDGSGGAPDIDAVTDATSEAPLPVLLTAALHLIEAPQAPLASVPPKAEASSEIAVPVAAATGSVRSAGPFPVFSAASFRDVGSPERGDPMVHAASQGTGAGSAAPTPFAPAFVTGLQAGDVAPSGSTHVARLAAGIGFPAVLDLSGDDWVLSIARDIAAMTAPDAPIEFRLKPDHLGEVQVTVDRADAGHVVTLTASSREAALLLGAGQGQLLETLRGQGFQQVDVQLSGRSGGDGQERRHDRPEPARREQAPADGEPAPRRGRETDLFA